MVEMDDKGGWLDERLAAVPRGRVTVFGDFCLDAYWLIDPDESERSVETGLPVRRVRQQRYSLGGAGNIVANLAELGVGAVRAVGLIGEDLFGRQMRDLLADLHVDCAGLLQVQSDWQTLVYSKPCVGEAEINRVDFGGFNQLSSETIERLAEALDIAAQDSDVVILNQQVPGGLSPEEMIRRLNEVVASHPDVRFIADSRHRPGLYRRCLLKVNAHEAGLMLGIEREPDERVPASETHDHASRLHERTNLPVFVTRGEFGSVVADNEGLHEIPGIQVIERTDTVGAGDTVVSALAAVLATGGDPVTAARLANIAASVTVRKLQTTGTASPDEIRAIGPDPDYIYLPELADDPRQARYLDDRHEIEIIREAPAELKIRHALFDHDGTISTLRQGWEGIMEPMMIHSILGLRYDSADEGLYHKVVDTVRRRIERTTGIQTLVQMQGLVELVRQFGCVQDKDILDMHGYKAIYNTALLEMVRQRLSKLQAGELDPVDFQIKGAVAMLEALHQRDVKLYLASGTDHADVVAEAEALGYADLFEGRIFGAVGDVAVDAKRVVIERILQEHQLAGRSLVAIGDGPVEIREARKRGGMAIGIASDEVRRFGLEPAKRRRLILAGADLIVADFTRPGELLGVLNLN
jgi:rfaE bifunctional protein kinase chain/domain